MAVSPSNPDDLIDQHLPAGTYFLEVDSIGGAGTYTLTTTLTPATAAVSADLRSDASISRRTWSIVAGDFNGDGRIRPGRRRLGWTARSRCCWATATARSSPRSPIAVGNRGPSIVAGDFNGDGHLDLAVADWLRQSDPAPSRCCWATATAPSSPRSPTRSGSTRMPSWRATSTATASLDLAVAN